MAAETVAREAANAGVRQIVYLGGLGADAPTRRRTCAAAARPEAARLRGRPGDDPARGHDHRQGERRLRDDPRPGQRLPVMVTPSWVSTPTQPIALDDVARYLAGVCGNKAAYGEADDTGGRR